MHKVKGFLIILLIISSIDLSAQGKWNCNLGLGASMNTGNVNNCNVSNDASLKRNDSLISLDFHYKLLYSSLIDKTGSDEQWKETNFEINGGMKFDLYQYDKYSPFLACEMITNKYKGYDLKVSGLIGMKFRLFTKPGRYDYSISGAFVYDGVDFSDNTYLPTNNYRISIRPKIKQRIVGNLSLVHQTFYQPSVLDWNDFIIYSVTKLQNKITLKLFLDITFTYEYRSRVPSDGYKHNDMLTEVSIRYKM